MAKRHQSLLPIEMIQSSRAKAGTSSRRKRYNQAWNEWSLGVIQRRGKVRIKGTETQPQQCASMASQHSHVGGSEEQRGGFLDTYNTCDFWHMKVHMEETRALLAVGRELVGSIT